MSYSDAIKVVARVRPFAEREKRIKGGTQCIITMKGQDTYIRDPENGKERKFTFDYSYWSHDESNEFVTQSKLFEDIGTRIIDNALEGYNTSLFAYGQTGSGKTYTMMGYAGENNIGIVPRICRSLFQRIGEAQSLCDGCYRNFRVEASMMEIYNEQVRDLFNPTNPLNSSSGLRVRENPQTGPYVEGLETCVVNTYDDVLKLMDEGNRLRTIAKTNMNDVSSRAHTIFQIILASSIEAKGENGEVVFSERISRINLIDLAGSERADKSGATGERLREGSAINVSLTALGNVIEKLSEKAENPNKKIFVPYRNSVLTWLLKESLGGNSKTIMIATISPSDYNFQETLSTLRYASRAKQIKNNAKVNEDPNALIIRELRDEIQRLKELLTKSNHFDEDSEKIKLREQLNTSQKMIEQLQMSNEEKQKRTLELEKARRKALEEAGISFTDMGEIAGTGARNIPHILNLNEDPMLSGLLIYFFKLGVTKIGRDSTNCIVLKGFQIRPEHCVVERAEDSVTLKPLKNAVVYVNGRTVNGEAKLQNNDRIILGSNHVFKYVDPTVTNEETRQIDWAFAQEEITKEQKRIIENAVEEKEREIEQHMKLKLLQIEQEFEKEKYKQQEIIDRQLKELEEQKQKIEELDNNKKKKKGGSLKKTFKNVFKTIQLKLAPKKNIEDLSKRDLLARNRIDENLVRLLPLIKEANDMVKDMKKNIRYDLKIVVKNNSPFLNVQAVDKDKKKTTMWTTEEFEVRILKMRERYSLFLNPKIGPNYEEMTLTQDPFYGSVIDVIGSAKFELKDLARRKPKEEVLPLLNSEGETNGHLLIAIIPLVPGDTTMKLVPNPVSNPDLLLGQSLHFLIKIKAVKDLKVKSKDTFIRFRFYTEKFVHTSKQNGNNLLFNFHRRYCVRIVNEDLINYLEDGFVQFDLIGELSQEEGRWLETMRKTNTLSSLSTSEDHSPLTNGFSSPLSPLRKRMPIPNFTPPSPIINTKEEESPTISERNSNIESPQLESINEELDLETVKKNNDSLIKENVILKARLRRLSFGKKDSSPYRPSPQINSPISLPAGTYSLLNINIKAILNCPYAEGSSCCKVSLEQALEGDRVFHQKIKTKEKPCAKGDTEYDEIINLELMDTAKATDKIKIKFVHNGDNKGETSISLQQTYEMFRLEKPETLSFLPLEVKLLVFASFFKEE
ncbi:hypothetical protein ABK040_005494 [Willaertia magna]